MHMLKPGALALVIGLSLLGGADDAEARDKWGFHIGPYRSGFYYGNSDFKLRVGVGGYAHYGHRRYYGHHYGHHYYGHRYYYRPVYRTYYPRTVYYPRTYTYRYPTTTRYYYSRPKTVHHHHHKPKTYDSGCGDWR